MERKTNLLTINEALFRNAQSYIDYYRKASPFPLTLAFNTSSMKGRLPAGNAHPCGSKMRTLQIQLSRLQLSKR